MAFSFTPALANGKGKGSFETAGLNVDLEILGKEANHWEGAVKLVNKYQQDVFVFPAGDQMEQGN